MSVTDAAAAGVVQPFALVRSNLLCLCDTLAQLLRIGAVVYCDRLDRQRMTQATRAKVMMKVMVTRRGTRATRADQSTRAGICLTKRGPGFDRRRQKKEMAANIIRWP